MKKLGAILFSTRTTGTMLILFAFAMAMGTFVENDYGTPVAKALIYDCWWFELIMIILVLNFLGNISRYRLYQRKKLPLLVFHLAFVLIFIGGAVTRYISFEGSMSIGEGESSNSIVTDKTFFKVHIGNENNALAYKDLPVTLLSDRVPFYLKPFKRDFEEEYDFYGERVKLKVIGFYPRAQDSLIKDAGGVSTLHLVVLENGKRVNKYITSGSVLLIQNLLVGFNKETEGAINISNASGSLQISSSYEGNYMIMATQERKTVSGNSEANEFHMRSLYTYGSLAFVVPEAPVPARIIHLEGDKKTHENDPDLVQLAITTNKATDTVSFYGGRGFTDFQQQVQVGDLRLSLAYGSKIYETPFSLKLTDFKMEKYPGSESPSSYSSDVMIQDNGKETPYKIYMNHVLDHSGYRFFQSSFYPDEKGTILSVNHDAWGTNITYIGYTLLFLGMFVTLFWRGTHFSKLNEQLKQLSKTTKVTLLCLSFLALGQGAYSEEIDTHGTNGAKEHEHHANDGHDHSGHDHGPALPASESEKANMQQMLAAQAVDARSFAATVQIDPAHAEHFGRLLVQDFDGRIEPINTLALEILRKIHGKERFHSLNANQFLLAISSSPLKWLTVPLIQISAKGGNEALKKLKADENGYTTMINLLTIGGDGSAEFILADDYRKAFAKKPADQGTYDKFVLELNDKLYAMQQLIDGHYLRILPLAGDKNNTWVAMPYDPVSGQLNNPVALYFSSVVAAQSANNWKGVDDKLNHIKQLQLKHGKDVVPSEAKIEWEIRYNSWNLFLKIMIVYSILGTIILALAFIRLFKQNKLLDRFVLVLLILIGTAAALQAMGLGVRWYISGHEPWSNGYEAVLFISWIGVLSGMLLYRNSNAFILAAGCLIAVILMGFAHGGSQMNPQITPLVPVLKSYWLMIHVAIITSSYGFFGLSALLGTVVLILFIIDNDKIAAKVKSSVAELSIVNELSLTVGVFLLTVGTFLGGIWANESWGRYWSWDPKETWAFISVIVYAFVLHVRLIPKMQSKYLFNLLSLISFSTIIMTYFGVNYYLSGLHSYAQGDPVPVPDWVYITVAAVFLLALVAYLRHANRKRNPIK
ncbi:cytochrome C biogenesis protein CcsB [Pedobacter psychroterrae]|uniref:Cytochrome C biogenesis protein CcsB n=1 Tax=Pedobacter psychroterrae TaxID=2530453 RepID=A0A4R0NP80_9SPHI|nr:cytochrome C biogenesis protein CcsB [Pedobacter psychroterrae]